MSKNKTNRILIVVLLVLMVAVVANQIIKNKKGERTFNSELTSFSADEVESISIFTKANGFEPMVLTREDEGWVVTFGDKKYTADPDMTANIAGDLGKLKAVQFVANNKDKWGEFDVSDTTGVRVLVEGGKDQLCDVFIGRFSYNQNSQKASTYVRLSEDKEVYSVEGYLGMVFNRDINSYRNKSLFRGNQNDLTRVSFQYPGDSAFSIDKLENKWMLGEAEADSAATTQFLSEISYLVGSEFNDSFDPADNSYQSYTATIEGNNMSSVVLTGYRNEEGNAVIVSNLNPNSFLDASTSGLFEKVFKGPGHFKIQD